MFVASLISAWRDVESVITAISHFSLWSKTLHCWQKLSKSTNQRVYQDLVYRNALLLKILTSVPAPLSPVPLYFSSLSLLRTALHYLNAWNRLMLWPWWMYCGYFFWWGEGKQRNTVSDMSTSVSRKAIKTSTWPQHYMIPHVSTRSRYFSTSDAKNNKRNLKFSLHQDSIRSQCISNRFFLYSC